MAEPSLVSSSLEIRVDGRGEAAYVEIHGQLDRTTAPQLALTLADIERAGVFHYAIDLSGAEFMDSSGVRALLDAARRASRRGHDVTLRRPRPEVRRLLKLAAPEVAVAD